MMTGTIKTITDKGFGFIADTKGQEYFFHRSAVQGTRFEDLHEGQSVEFDVGQGPKGPAPKTCASSDKWSYHFSAVEDRTFQIEFLDPGVQAFAFTFG
jgi:cold shock protein